MQNRLDRVDEMPADTATAILEPDGYQLVHAAVALTHCQHASQMIDLAGLESAGSRRMLDHRWCADLAALLKHHPEIERVLPEGAVAIQCTLFEKSEQKNWLVALHRDQSVCVSKHVSVKGWNGWSEKEGLTFVQPPRVVLAGLLGVRLHLDDCPIAAGALRVVAKSHQRGEGEINNENENKNEKHRHESDAVYVPAKRGDALLLRPLLLHASSKASLPARRRVLHFLFAPRQLNDTCEDNLRWRWAV